MRRAVNPSPAIVGKRLRHLICGPLLRPGIKPEHLPPVQYPCPHLSILVRHRFVEISERAWSSRRPMFHNAARLGIELYQSTVTSAEPSVVVWVKTPSLRRGHVSACVLIQPFSRPKIQTLFCISPRRQSTSAVEVPIIGNQVVIAEANLKGELL